MGAFDHLEWTYDGAFEQIFGFGRGEFEQKFSKNSNARGLPGGGMLKLRFDWYISFANQYTTKITVSDGHPTAVALSPSESIALTIAKRFKHFKISNCGNQVQFFPSTFCSMSLSAILDEHAKNNGAGRERTLGTSLSNKHGGLVASG